jgi:hypothetical protein
MRLKINYSSIRGYDNSFHSTMRLQWSDQTLKLGGNPLRIDSDSDDPVRYENNALCLFHERMRYTWGECVMSFVLIRIVTLVS